MEVQGPDFILSSMCTKGSRVREGRIFTVHYVLSVAHPGHGTPEPDHIIEL